MVKQHLDGSPIHIIKIKVVQVGRHLWVSFFIGDPPHRYQAKDLLQPHAHQLKFFKYPKTNFSPFYSYLRVVGSLFPFWGTINFLT